MSAQEGFMQVADRLGIPGDTEGDKYGGADGTDGSGLPTGSPNTFMFATGIECSYPKVKGVRRDLLQETGHYERYKEDLGLVREIGLKCLRYGLPWHRIHLGPDRYDWDWADAAMAEIKRLEITPILDLLHFGVPDWLGDFQNPEWPARFAQYVAEVAQRYPWVRFYTPVNEIYVTARFSGMEGIWNEGRADMEGFVTALKHLVGASIYANHRIAKYRPNCIIVQSESAEFVHDLQAEPCADTLLQNQLRFLSLDLLYAKQPDANVLLQMMDAGLKREEYDWFMRGEPPGYQIMGNDYYMTNEQLKLPDGSQGAPQDVLGWYLITKEYYERYGKPVFHTETNLMDAEKAPDWLWKQWANVLRIRRDRVPVLGFTWYSLLDQVDWDIQLREKNDRINACGLYDLDRRIRPVGEAYKQLLQAFGNIAIVPEGEMLELSERPATLKTIV
jgi:beta-glucosidase/6-phospho-beta-glucosidase/beta-galactosidase